MKRQRKLVVCVSIAGAHCLKIKGLRSKALTTAVWLLHVLGHSAQICSEVWKFTSWPKYVQNTCHPKHFPSVTWASFSCLWQIMSIEDVERILDETQESIEYQRVNVCLVSVMYTCTELFLLSKNCVLKQCYTHIYSIVYIYIAHKQWGKLWGKIFISLVTFQIQFL